LQELHEAANESDGTVIAIRAMLGFDEAASVQR
jgi:hypothetical protein